MLLSFCRTGNSVGGGGNITSSMPSQLSHSYNEIISLENLLAAWREFVRGKRQRRDVQEFEKNLLSNLLSLHTELTTGEYQHSHYTAYNISDPKPRNIHKAVVRDRVLHHALYRKLYPFFDRTFIFDSYSCRRNKGSHRSLGRFQTFARKVSLNNTRTCWVLKCDIKKFFASIDHGILLAALARHIPDRKIMSLLQKIAESFQAGFGLGLPLGNLSSQLFCNIYLNELDQFVKHQLKVKHYIRYADDFVFFSWDKVLLEREISQLSCFLEHRLRLSLHPKKILVQTVASGVDFLGWVHFPHHRVLRMSTKRKMFRKMTRSQGNGSLQSYLGLLKHGNSHKLSQQLLSTISS
jgi:RNA-directed DNA polymerase